MSEMLRNHMNEALDRYARPVEKMRSPQEVMARYNQMLGIYQQLSYSNDEDDYGQKLSAYAEIKALGWVLGKHEKNVIKDIVAHSNKMPFGTF